MIHFRTRKQFVDDKDQTDYREIGQYMSYCWHAFYEGVCCTHIYIYIYIQYLQSQVAFFFQLADHVTELCLDKVEANCK